MLCCRYRPFLSFGFILNVFGFQDAIASAWAATDIPMIILPLLAFALCERRYYAAITAIYVPLLALDF